MTDSRAQVDIVTPHSAAAPAPADLEQSMDSLVSISQSLLQSYTELSRRAKRMERELFRANADLKDKVSELDGAKRHLEGILQALPTGVVVRDSKSNIVLVNEAASNILGEHADDLIGRIEHAGLLGPAANGEPREFVDGRGTRRVLSSRYSRIHGDRGDGSGSVEILDDRTEVTDLTERLHRYDKLAALGNMAGGIAHEIRNPLNGVEGFAALLNKRLPRGSKEALWARRIVEGAEEANAILGSMLSLADPRPLALQMLDARELVDDAIRCSLGGPTGRENDARWTLECFVECPPFAGDRIKLRQALRNLIVNAMGVQPGGGPIHVMARRDGDEIVLRVDDAGPGVCESDRSRIFEPFFTTRAEGTGLGLALVHTIARMHGGRAEVSEESAPLGGASFAIRVPADIPSESKLSSLRLQPKNRCGNPKD